MEKHQLNKKKSFIHPVFGKVIGYNNKNEFDKAIKEWNDKEINKKNK
jgi:hypothetical protein|tara:strand:+ start:923 stop:1063 length:141 start_codon:yes stop_codon:yes gene_type:complete